MLVFLSSAAAHILLGTNARGCAETYDGKVQVTHPADAVEELVGRHIVQLRQVFAAADAACVTCAVLANPASSMAGWNCERFAMAISRCQADRS